jgi:serine phosphatase RsbU (regulator of sigma subunit)
LDEDRCLVAVADCTGHGVPGAMMATLGCSLLNEVVLQDPWRDPAELLHHLNQRLIQSLHQQGQHKGAGDGMDIALCRIDRHMREIIFAGAFRPLYWIHDGQLTVINGDRKPIGGSHFEPERKFTVHRLAYHPGDRVYLFSDGYVDQFGGPEHKKFMLARFNALLLGEQHLGMDLQRDLLARVFDEWRGASEQVDDVCIMGLQMRA